MCIPLHRKVRGTSYQALGYEGVVHGNHQQGNDVENEEGGHGVNLRVQLPGMGIGSAGDEALVKGDIKRVEVRINSLRNSQDQGKDPDEYRPQDNAGSGG